MPQCHSPYRHKIIEKKNSQDLLVVVQDEVSLVVCSNNESTYNKILYLSTHTIT